jgi:hypothetical protein
MPADPVVLAAKRTREDLSLILGIGLLIFFCGAAVLYVVLARKASAGGAGGLFGRLFGKRAAKAQSESAPVEPTMAAH